MPTPAVLAVLPAPLVGALAPVVNYLTAVAVPRPLKWVLAVYLAANACGFPGVWHWRILWPFIRFQWEVKLGRVWKNDRIGKDELTHTHAVSRKSFRATPESCDAFGFHLSNSSYAVTLDHIRGPFSIYNVGEFFMIPGATFALGGTQFEYKKEIPFLGKYDVESALLGYDKKWMYIESRFVSPPHPKTGARKLYAASLGRTVLKHNRRTIPPARAFALAGYDSDHGKGAQNWEIVKGLSRKEKLAFLLAQPGQEEGKARGITVGSIERGMDKVQEWPAEL
ncbi:hypothetical protein JCM8097_009409 [Rhodosporidiobolus ruineniae]